MKHRRYRYAGYGYEHPAFFTRLISRHRWRSTAQIAALWFQRGLGSLSYAWVRDETVFVACLPRASIER